MKLEIYQVDAFTDKMFSGNPAAVVILKSDIDEELMQSIALENNLSETAFINIANYPIKIKLFTPTIEVNLCGHATLASAKILFENFPEIAKNEILFDSKSGILKVFREGDLFCLNFPADQPESLEIDPSFEKAIGIKPLELLRGKDDYLAIFDEQSQIEGMNPNFYEIAKFEARGLVVSAAGKEVDFVSRCFYPRTGIDEDPVTGSAHTMLIPYWKQKLNKNYFKAKQLSRRGGNLKCRINKDRVYIYGKAILFLKGSIYL